MDMSSGPDLLEQCGKMALLDRLLIKFHRTGHRVLLFWCAAEDVVNFCQWYMCVCRARARSIMCPPLQLLQPPLHHTPDSCPSLLPPTPAAP